MSKVKTTMTIIDAINKSTDQAIILGLKSEEIRNHNLGNIAVFLSDIAVSLALIADHFTDKEGL